MASISIITATRNVADTLEKCLQSVESQGVDVEHIIIDCGSTDATLKILNEHRENISRIISEPDEGIYDAMNKGLRQASGDIIGILNADDFYPVDNVLKKVLKELNNPEISACYGDLVYVDSQDLNKKIRYWRAGKFEPGKFYQGWMPPHPTFFVKKSVYDEFGLFNLELGSAADYEIMLRFLLKHKIKTVYIQEVLVHMRVGGVSNATLLNRIQANRMDRKAWTVNDLQPKPWTIYLKPARKIYQWFMRP